MVADDLVGRVVAELRDEPVGVLLVERGALPLGDRVVRRVADEDVAEAEAVVSRQRRPVGSDQLLADERQQVRADRGSLGLGQQRSDGAAVEEPPFDRAALDHGALRLAEPVDARGEQRLQRRRHLELAVLALGPHGDELLDEERVPLGRVDDPLPRLLGEIAEPLHERLAVLLRERVQVSTVALGLGAVHVGRVSNRSGRAVHRRRRGTSCTNEARYSTRSRNAVSAQWMSSKTTTRGPVVAIASSSLRTPQEISSGETGVSVAPSAASMRTAASSASLAPWSAARTSPTWDASSWSGQYVIPSP